MFAYDIKKVYPKQYSASDKKISRITASKMNCIMIDGVGNPRIEEFQQKSDAMWILIKEVKKELRKQGIRISLPPLEGLWDTYDNAHFDVTRKKMIKYTLIMSLHESVDEKMIEDIKTRLIISSRNPYIIDIYFKSMEERECVQMLHIGPYHTEINTTKQIMEYITVENLKLSGMHHEIYLNNPDKVDEKDLKTIVRYQIEG